MTQTNKKPALEIEALITLKSLPVLALCLIVFLAQQGEMDAIQQGLVSILKSNVFIITGFSYFSLVAPKLFNLSGRKHQSLLAMFLVLFTVGLALLICHTIVPSIMTGTIIFSWWIAIIISTSRFECDNKLNQ